MAEHYRFFDSTADDERVYTADEFAEYFRRVLTDGIFNGGTNLKVETNGTDIRTYIQPGYAWVQGYMYKIDTEPLYLQHEYPDPNLDRIDRVVIRLDKRLEHRYVRAFILKGTPAAFPVPPLLTRDENVFELSLAQVRIIKGKSYIEGPQIIDERLNNSVCGLVNSLIQADTTTIFNQFQHWYNSRTTAYQKDWGDWFETAVTRFGKEWTDWLDARKREWTDWFGNVKANGFVTIIDTNKSYRIGLGGDFANLNEALDSLRTTTITRKAIVNLRLLEGIHHYNSEVLIDHPNGSRINILGEKYSTTEIISAGTPTGQAKEWIVPVTVVSTTGLEVGKYAIIRSTTGTGEHYSHRGVWEITAIVGNVVTLKNTFQGSVFPESELTGGQMITPSSVLKFSSGNGIRVNRGGTLYSLSNVVLVGSRGSGYYGISAYKNSNIFVSSNVGVTNFYGGLYAEDGGNIDASSVAASGNTNGFSANRSGSITSGNGIATGNSLGFSAERSSHISCEYATSSGNLTAGFFASGNSYIHALSAIASSGSIGFNAANQSMINATLAKAIMNSSYGFIATDASNIYAGSTTAENNLSSHGADYRAARMSMIFCGSYVGSPVFSPQKNIIGNANSLITEQSTW